MAKSLFKSVDHAVSWCARALAQKAVKEKMRGEGRRMCLVPPKEITEKAQVYLAEHPELYEQAVQRAREMGFIDPSFVQA
jgi:hypothetical protein